MKELQNFVYRHMDALKHHKRYLAMLTALSMLVTFIVPLILVEPADSMTKQRLMVLSDSTGSSYPESFDEIISGNDANIVYNAAGMDGNQVGNVIYSPAQMDILTLLFGAANDSSGNLTHQSLYAGCSTIEEALEVDKETYFLGYASDFCAFIEGDFTATEADAEGRMAVGGDLTFTKDWNYQIGSGDYATMKPLQSIDGYNEYDNMYGFASALVGGKMFRINTLSTGYGHTRTSKDSLSQEEIRADIDAGYHAVNKDNKYSYSVYYKPEDGLYKYFIVDNAEGSAHYFKDKGEDIPYNKNLSPYPDVECTHDYKADCEICATNPETHSYLGNINELAQMYSMPDGYTVGGLIRDTFEYVRSRSEVLTRINSINVTPNGENIIFDATGKVKPDAKTVYFTVDNWTGNYGYIEFKGIPENASVIVNCNNSGVVYAVGGEKNEKKDVKTVFNGKSISNKEGPGNNSPESSRILYNFTNATELHINGNFNGTILAPNADVKSKDNECTGHLSGALIAKSFYGGLEFGYRPYRAGNDILGMTSGYEVPVDKLIANTATLLPGAMFEIAEVINGEENVLSLFESDDSTKYVALPSYIDFSGNTNYITEIESVVNNQTKLETLSVTSNTELKSSVEITAYRTNNDNTFSDPIPEDDLLNLNIGDTIYLVANQNVKWSGGNFNFDQNPALYKQVQINDVLNNVTVTAQLSDNIKDTITLSTEEIKLVVSPKYIVKGDTVNYSLTGVSSNNSLHYIMYYLNEYNNENVLSQGNSNSTTYNFDRTGKVYVKTQFNTDNYTDSFEVMYLESPSECTVDDTILFSIPNAPSDATITYTFNGSNVENNTSFVVPNSVGDSIPIVATIDLGENNVKTIENRIKVNAKQETGGGENTGDSTVPTGELSISADTTYYVAQSTEIKITVEQQPDGTKYFKYDIYKCNSDGGIGEFAQTLQSNLTENTYTFAPQQSGTWYVVVEAYGDSGLLGSDKVKISSETQVNDVVQQSLYSVRKASSYLSDNNSGVLEITSGEADKYITNLTLNFQSLENINNYSFKCKYYSDNNTTTSETVSKTDFNSYTKTFDENDKITKVEVEILTGAVIITSYDLTCVVPCSYLVKKYFTDITANDGVETTVFECSESISDFESLTFKLDNNPIPDNRNIGLKLYKKEGDNYTEIKSIWDGCSFNTNGELVINNEFLKNNSINISDLRRITIQAKDGATNLHVNVYSLSTFVSDPEYTLPEKEPEIITETHKYTIKEAKAPQGYFKTDDYYEVTITETLSTANVVNNTIPMLVHTEIHVDYFKAIKDENGNTTGYEEKVHYYQAPLTIQYGTKEKSDGSGDNEPDLNTRIITIGDETFTIKKNNDGGKITSVTSNSAELEYSEGKQLKDCKATEFTHNGKKYYYNPETMMIIPLPLENDTEKNLEFSNEPGILFKKVDERGMSVEGATISLTTKGEPITFTDSSKLFELGNFVLGTEYEFSETNKPNGYENAKPIKFKIFNDANDENKLKVTWWTVGENDTKINEKTQLIEDTVIEMVDERILGVKLQLKKIDADTKVNLSGAIFELYASDDTLIKSGINAGDGTGVDIDLTTVEDTGNKFIENGYLKPGSYYLLETSRPTDSSNYPYKDPGKICFTVGDAANNYGITYVPNTSGGSGSGSGSASGGTLTKDEADAGWNDGTYNYWLNDLNGISMKETDSGGKIENVKRIQVVLTPWNGNAIQLKQCWTNLGQTCDTGITDKFTGENTVSRELDWTLDSATDLTQFKIVGSSIIVAYVKVTTADGTEYVFQDASYNPVSTASLEDEISTAANGDEPAVIDESDADTKAPILAPVTSEGDNKTTLVIANEVDDGKVDITVKKVWPNDGFDSARPSVTIKLWRTTTEISEDARNNPLGIGGQQVRDSDGNPITVTLSGDTWSHTFTDLDSRYADADGGFGQYYYYIIEDTVVGYTAASYTIVGNELTVTNELDPVEVKVEKIWNTDSVDTIPESVTLQLQVRIESDVNGPLQPENYTWENVEGKTITLVKSVFNGSKTWSGDDFKITGLLKGKTYRLTETDVPGWRITDGSQKVLKVDENGDLADLSGQITNGKLSITNEPKPPETGNLTISKYWDTDEGKPGEVYVKLYRKAIEKYWPEQSAADVQQDYARLLQYSLYFYDANMCGGTAEEHSALSWRNNCHIDDQVPGGYHDAGDHVMFGLPQGYSASMLGWSYYEFKDAYDDLGQTEHLKLITEHFCDFFVECISDDGTEILVQKGAGNPDHEYWGAPELQVDEYSRMDEVELTDDGRGVTGWTDGKKTLENEMFWRSTGGDIAAEYAAALALAYLNFYDENASQTEKDKYNGYLAKAIEFYNFAQGKGVLDEWGVNKDETATEKPYPGFYGSGGADDDRALAAGWLYLATQKQGNANDNYKNACSNDTPGWAFSWNDVSLAAACVYAHVNGDTSDAWSKVREFLTGGNGINSNLKSDGYFCRDAWGSARYNAALQMVALVAAKYNTSEAQTYKNFAQTQMAKILGDNTWNDGQSVCLVTGFADNSAQYAHHRAASGWDSHTEYKVNPDYDKDGHMLIGAMVGGPSFGKHDEDQMRNNGHTNLTTDVHGTYVDDLHDYCCNEVALDYQAGLVGAAAGLYYFFESGHTYEIPGVEKQYLQPEPEILIPPEYYVNNEVVMTVGTEVYLAALDFAESDVTWSITDNNGNATISDSGIFKALNAGKVTVKAESGTQVVTVEINIVNAENAQIDEFFNVSFKQKNAISKLDDESNANKVRLSSQETSIGYDTEYSLTQLLNAIYAAEKQVNSIEFEGHSGNLNLYINGTQIGNGWNVSNGFDLNENNISQPITSIKVQNWGNNGLTDIVFNCGYKPVIIRPSSYYVSRNNSFTVTYENKRSENIEWTTLPEGFNAVGDVISVGAVTPGTYTITGKDNGSDTSCTFRVVVLPAGKMAHEVDTSDWTGAWQKNVPVPRDLQDKIDKIAIKFNKKGTTNDTKFKIDGISGDVNFTDIDDTLFYECDNNKDTLDNIFVVTYHNPDNVIPERIYFIYSTGDTFDITPEKASLVLGEKTKLNVSNHTGEITWTPNDYVTITKESDGYYATLNYNASGSTSITITGTDTDGKSGSATISVKPLSVNATGAVVGEKITVKTDNEPIDCNIEYSYEVVNNSQGSVAINGADITANTAGTVKIIAIAKLTNGTEVSRATSSEITISPWTINGVTPMEVDDIKTFTSKRTGTFTWSSSNPDVATIVPDTGEVTAKSNGDTIITVSDGTYTSEPFKLVVNNKTFSFTINGEELDVNETYEIHEGESIELIPNLDVKSYDYNSDYIDINYDIIPHIITAKAQTPNEITITATATDNQIVTFKIYVVGSFSIVDPNGESYATDESSRMMYNGERLQLRTINSVGNVHWAITPQGDDQIAIVDPDTGLVTAIKSGDVVVTATDENGTTATYNITVKLKAVDPGFDYSNGGFEDVDKYTISGNNGWELTIDNLDLTDENGNYYMYYIVECDGSGNPISSNGTIQSIQGIGATFVPIEYENGVMLAQVKTNGVSVKNSLSGRVQGQLPSTGGSGVTTYYYLGGVIMLLSIAGFTGLKRRERKRRKE